MIKKKKKQNTKVHLTSYSVSFILQENKTLSLTSSNFLRVINMKVRSSASWIYCYANMPLLNYWTQEKA